MRVLVMGPPGVAISNAIAPLEAAGHEVVRCSEADAPPFPCKAFTGTCPLDEGPIDAAVVVLVHESAMPTVFDRGVTCAVRERVPVVLAGNPVPSAYYEWATETVDPGSDLAAALERLVAAPARDHEAVATVGLRQCLAAAGIEVDGDVRAEVVRRGGRLKVRLHVPQDVGDVREENLARRVIDALRQFDHHARGIDVGMGPGREGYAWKREG